MDGKIHAFLNFASSRKTAIAASAIGAFLLFHFWSWFLFFLWLIPHIFVSLLGLVHGAGLALCQGKYYKPRASPSWSPSPVGKLILQRVESDPRLRRLRQRRDADSSSTMARGLCRLTQPVSLPVPLPTTSPPSRVVVSRNIDVVFSEIFDLISRDFILSWLAPLSRDPLHLVDQARRIYWHVLSNVSERLDAINYVNFMSTDLMNLLDQHFIDIRLATQGDDVTRKKTPFKPHSHLESPERELKFLRRVADSVLWILLPEDERDDEVLRGLLREVLAYDILYPTINSMCDPDYINQSLLNWIEYRESVATAQKRTYAYAKNYEEFIKMIDESDDVEQLKQIRYQVMTEIMQATTIKKLKQTDSKSPSHAPDSVVENEPSPSGRQTKGEMLKSRNLKRYINQCTIAKSVAEKRLRVIGGRDYAKYGVDDGAHDDEAIPGKKVLSFNVVMASNSARAAFLKYLQREEVAPLLLFWEGVAFRMKKPAGEEKETCTEGNAEEKSDAIDKDYVSQIHHVGTELYQRHINAIQSVVKLNKTTIRGMHAFLLGDEGPEPFETVKSVIGRALEEKYYPSFLVSEIYYNFVSHISSDEFEDADDGSSAASSRKYGDDDDDGGNVGASTFSLVEPDSRPALVEHSTYAQKKLFSLSAKLLNKYSALDALKAAQKPAQNPFSNVASGSSASSSLSTMTNSSGPCSNSKRHRLISQLENEVEVLQAERCQLEAFIERTDSWLEHVGKWRVTVSQNGKIEEGGKIIVYFVLLVHLEGQGNHADESSEGTPAAKATHSKYSATHGFVVTRRLSDFHLLHKKLQPLASQDLAENRSFKLPSPGIFDKDTSDRFLEKAMAKLQTYMTTVMTDHKLCQSEALYAFCCPTPEFLVGPGTGGGMKGGKSVFYYAGLEGFGAVPGSGGVMTNSYKEDATEKTPFSGIKRAFSSKKTPDDNHLDDPHEYLVQEDGGNGEGKKLADSFAEPLYRLVAEIFELRGVFRFFRQSLITFVRVTFGKSINKQLRDFIQWLFGDSMSVYYLTLFKDSMWLPDGQLAPSPPPRTDDEKHDTRRRCKLKLVKNIPDALNHLFGHQTSQQGVIKIFESFQDARLNKHLFYSVFELVVFEVFPELKNVD